MTFVAALGVVLLVVGAVVLALAPSAPPADCPDPSQVCGGPPDEPTLPPASQVAGQPPASRGPGPAATATSPPTIASTGPPATAPATATAAAATPQPSPAPATPAATPPPAATPVAPSAGAPTDAPTASPTEAPTGPPATPEPTTPTAFVVPAPRPASGAAPFRAGSVWRSEEFGFSFEWDPDIWTIREEGPEFAYMTAARGNVALTIGGYDAAEKSAQQAFADEVVRLEGQNPRPDREPDPGLQLPGLPNIGYRLGLGGVFAGTVNSPQGPTIPVSVALLTASDSDRTIIR